MTSTMELTETELRWAHNGQAKENKHEKIKRQDG